MTSPESRFRAQRDEIENHPGRKAKRAWDALNVVHTALLKNQAVLVYYIEAIQQNQDDLGWAMISNSPPPEPRRAIHQEIFRLCHNYLASAGSLVYQARHLMGSYEGKAVHEEYLARVRILNESGLAQAVIGLRNLALHGHLPPIGGLLVGLDTPNTEMTVVLNRDSTLQAWDFGKPARLYLEAQPPQIPLLNIVWGYHALLDDLYKWLYPQFGALHENDVRAVNALIAKTPGFRNADGTPGQPG